MQNEYDVVIIGAGPAGLACAAELGLSEKSVLLIEKNEVIGPKICAGGLTTKIKNIGYDLDMADLVFSQIKVNIPGKSIVVEDEAPFVATIDRKRLADRMLEEISDRVHIVRGWRVQKVAKDSILVGGESIKYKYLVGADGSNSMVRRYLGLDIDQSVLGLQYIVPDRFDDLQLFFDATYFDNGYAWIFPHADYTSIGCGGLIGRKKSYVLRENFEKWLQDQDIDVSGGRFEGWVINFDYRGYDFDNRFLVGDAAGFTSGMTGEGIYFAIVSGMEVARKILDPNYDCVEIDNILRVKKRQENFLHLTKLFNKYWLNNFYKLFPFVFGWGWAKKRAIQLFS